MSMFKQLPMALAVSSVIALTGCGGGSSSSDADSDTTSSQTISGTASAPAGTVAQLQSTNPFEIAMSFLISPAQAEITGLQPIKGADVELIRVDDDGNQIGDVLATTTTSISGDYELTLPTGVSLAGNLIVRITGQNDRVMRAQVVEQDVDISPVSEYVLQSFIDNGTDLDTLDPEKVVKLSGKVEEFDLTAGANLDEMFEKLNEVAGDYVATQVALIETDAGDATAISGNYRSSALSFNLHDSDNAGYGTYALDYYSEFFSFDGAADGRVDVTFSGGESAYSGLGGPGLANATVYYETDIYQDEEDTFSAAFNAANVLVVEGEFEEEFEAGDDEGFRYPAATYPLQKVKGENLFFVQAQDGAVRYALVDTDGDGETDALDPSQKRGDEAFRSIEVFAEVPANASTSDISGSYGRVYLASYINDGGPIEVTTEATALNFDGQGTVAFTATTSDRVSTAGYTNLDEPSSTSGSLTYSVDNDGTITIDGSKGFVNSGFNFIAFGGAFQENLNSAEFDTTYLVKLPNSAPAVTNKTYRLMFLGMIPSASELAISSTRFASTLTMTSETEATINSTTDEVILPGFGSNLTFNKGEASVDQASVNIAANGYTTMTVAGVGESTMLEGFFNEDGSLGVFRTTYAEENGDPTALGLAVLIELP